MHINKLITIPFGYKTVLSRLYKEHKLPIKKGLYGGILTDRELSNEHIIPHCVGGKTKLANIALATKTINNARSDKPISTVLTKKSYNEYFEQFKDVVVHYIRRDGEIGVFDGNEYIKQAQGTIKKLLKAEGRLDILS